MREYSFKPALLAKEQVWTIKDGHLLKRGGENALKLAELTGATWGNFAYRGTQSEWLYLQRPDDVTKLACNMMEGPELASFRSLVAAIAHELETVNPQLPVKTGGGTAFQWSLFLIGLFGGLFGLFFVYAGVMGLVKRSEGFAILFGLLMAGSLLYMAWSFAPWRTGTTVTPSELLKLVS